MRVLLYILGFWGGSVVGTMVGMAMIGSQSDTIGIFALIGSGVGIWLVKRSDAGKPQSQVDPQPQTSYTDNRTIDNRTIDNRRVFNIVAHDKDEAAQILRQLEQGDEPQAIDMDDVRHKMLEKKDKEDRAWPGYSDD